MQSPDDIKDMIVGKVSEWDNIRLRVLALEEEDESNDDEVDDWRDIQNDIANHVTDAVMNLIKMGDEAW